MGQRRAGTEDGDGRGGEGRDGDGEGRDGMRRAMVEMESEMMELERATMEMEVVEMARAEMEDAACGQDHSPNPGGNSLSFNAALHQPTLFMSLQRSCIISLEKGIKYEWPE